MSAGADATRTRRRSADEEFVASYRLNTISAYRMSMACLPHLLKATNATITNSGSFSSAVPAYDILPYATAKAALNQMMVSLAHLLARKVRVNSVLIGTVLTAGYADAGIDEAMQQRMLHPDTLTGRPGPARGRRQRHALAQLARQRLGQRADDQRAWRRWRGAPLRPLTVGAMPAGTRQELTGMRMAARRLPCWSWPPSLCSSAGPGAGARTRRSRSATARSPS